MQLPTFQILNEHFVKDMNQLIDTLMKNNLTSVSVLVNALEISEPINKNFDRINNFLQKQIPPDNQQMSKEQFDVHHNILTVFQNYITVNNIVSKLLSEQKDNQINLEKLITTLFHERYHTLNENLNKIDTTNPKKTELLTKVERIINSKNPQDCGRLEKELVPVLDNFRLEMMEQKAISPAQEYEITSFAFGSVIVERFLNHLFAVLQKMIQETEAKPEVKEDKVLTKEPPSAEEIAKLVAQKKKETTKYNN